jgi:hypothetical protein
MVKLNMKRENPLLCFYKDLQMHNNNNNNKICTIDARDRKMSTNRYY